MTINSKQKGSRGERELSKVLCEYGYECRRTQQYQGGTEESADVIGLPHIHIECKRVEKLNIDEAMEQAHTDSFQGTKWSNETNGWSKPMMPTVFHRKNSKPWKVTMYLDDWMQIYKEFEAGKAVEDKA